METIKKLISVILMICIVFSLPVASSAISLNSAAEEIKSVFNEALESEDGENNDPADPDDPEDPENPDDPSNPDDPDDPGEPTDPQEPEPDENEIVAMMYACVKFTIFGHVWIYIENTSDETIKVGALDVAPGEGASAGTFGISRAEGSGLYYNVEAYRAKGKVLGMSTPLTGSQLSTVNEKITNRNKWNFFGNCVAFTAVVWNSVSKNKIVPLVFPLFTLIHIAFYGSRFEMFKPDRENVYKQVGTGSGASLKEVKDRTADHFIG